MSNERPTELNTFKAKPVTSSEPVETKEPDTRNEMAMESPLQSSLTEKTLWTYIFKDPINKWYPLITIIAAAIQLIVFKIWYPYASFINGDSYSYLETAYHNMSINIYPIGYSMFLRLFSVFTRSDVALVSFQYILALTSIMAFLFTLFYFYRPSKPIKNILFCFMLFNPVLLYLANYVSSDAFFLSLSLIWFTQLFWIIHKPTKKLIIINAMILFIAFTVRYNALFYPFIAAITLFQGKKSLGYRLGGIILSFLLIGCFVLYTGNKYYELTGYKQFTPFTGWQTANNALYAFRYVDSLKRVNVPAKFQALDKIVRTYFDSTRDIKKTSD